MTVSLVGEVVNSCDATTGFNVGNISGDDDFVEGTGALGLKASNTTVELFTTTLGATAPYDFSSGGGEDGDHMIMWFNTKTPINATTGMTMIVGNGTDRGRWDVLGAGFYKGGFVTRVIDLTIDFDTIAAGTWTVGGNPAQLSNITEMGGGFTTITSIMGSFNNVQIDQITIGQGVRVDAGSVGVPNTFETVRAQDQDTSFWGWWSSAFGAVIGKGKLFIGPVTGSVTSVFNDSAFAVIFADERVAAGFYEITSRGAGTDVDWDLANISAANPANARWSLTIDSTTNSFADVNGLWSGADVITLDASSTLTGTTIIDSTSLVQNTAVLSGITVLSANTADGVAFITADDLSKITDSSFEFSDGHAIELTATGTYNSDGNLFTGYGADGTNDAAIYNNSGGAVTINVINGGDTPTIRNGASATTSVVVNPVAVTITARDSSDKSLLEGAAVTLEAATTGNLPFEDVVTITRSGTTATVSHTAHGLDTGQKIKIADAVQNEYNRIKAITVTGVNEYTYIVEGSPTTPATGTILATAVILDGLTNASGVISDTRTYSVDQAFTGGVRKGTASPVFVPQDLADTISKDTGFSLTVSLLPD